MKDFLTIVGQTLRPAAVRSAGLVAAAFEAAAIDTAMQALAAQLARRRSVTVAWIVAGVIDRAPLRQVVDRHRSAPCGCSSTQWSSCAS